MAFQPKKKIIMKNTLVSFEINPSGVLNPLMITLLTIFKWFNQKKKRFSFFLLIIFNYFGRTFFVDRNAIRENGRNSGKNRHPRKNNKCYFYDSQLGEERFVSFQSNAQSKEVNIFSLFTAPNMKTLCRNFSTNGPLDFYTPIELQNSKSDMKKFTFVWSNLLLMTTITLAIVLQRVSINLPKRVTAKFDNS